MWIVVRVFDPGRCDKDLLYASHDLGLRAVNFEWAISRAWEASIVNCFSMDALLSTFVSRIPGAIFSVCFGIFDDVETI